ncbi:MAG: WD40 repeat domain-containing protein, partial [Cyanobacteria bacterium]|nr:WD40 repeat domain-containing protein [Cyanobacteriota bacterium]
PSQLLDRWPTTPPGGPSDPAATRLRDQASTQLQKAGGLRPLTASLLADQALLRTLTGHGSTVNALAVLPDGRLASGADDGTIKPFRLGECPGGAPRRAARFGGR